MGRVGRGNETTPFEEINRRTVCVSVEIDSHFSNVFVG